MILRTNWLVISAVALCLGSCNKKEEAIKAPDAPVVAPKPEPPATPAPTPADKAPAPADKAPVPAPPPVAKVAALSPDARAAKLGFVKYLPPDTEAVIALHQGIKSVEHFKSSKLWKIVESEMGMGAPEGMAPEGNDPPEPMPAPEGDDDKDVEKAPLPNGDPDAVAGDADKDKASGAVLGNKAAAVKDDDALPEDADEGEMSPAVLFGTEFTIAMGKSTGEQAANMLTAYRRMGYFQMRAMAKAFVAAAKTGDFSSMEQAMSEQYGPQLMKDLLADPESGVALIERMKMPPLYYAFRTSAGKSAAAAKQLSQLTDGMAMMGAGMVEPVEVEKAGQKFTGHKISGAKISAYMAEERKDMDEVLEPALVDKLLAAVAKKNIVIVSGSIGDYAVLFVGSSVDDLKFAATPGESLVASDALAFGDSYASKELAAVVYGQKGAMDQLMAASGGLADLAGGLRDGLAGTDGLGDTRDLEALLRMVGERESALRKMMSTEAIGTVAYFEDGLKVESYGGTDSGAVDWKATNKLASLGDSEDVVMFANMTGEAAHDEKMRAYMAALMETVYAGAMKVSEVKTEEADMVKFKEMAKLFDTKFRPDLIAMWDAVSGDFGGSLGQERACIVDLSGSVPTLPGVPQAVVEQGKFPRLSMVAPVTDRAKLAASWQKINASATSMLAKINELTKQEIPMQKPASSEKDGFTTWFFPMSFFNDDFMPSVTVGDQWFAASTSKKQALDLIGKAAKGGETRTGLWFAMNFKALQKFSRETCKMLEKNADAIGGIPADKLAQASKIIDAMDDLDKLTIHARREGGVLRVSVHFKTR